MISEQKVINYLYAPFLFQIEVNDYKAINVFCLKYLVQQRWPDHEAFLSPSTFVNWWDHLRFCCNSDTSRFVADYFSVNGAINWIEAFQIHQNEFAFSDAVFPGVLSFAESLELEQTLAALGCEGSMGCSCGTWCQDFGMIPPAPYSCNLFKHQQWQHWHFNGHGGLWDNTWASLE